VKGYVVSTIRSVIDRSHGSNLQSALYFGRVVNQELQSNKVLTFPDVNGKGGISDG